MSNEERLTLNIYLEGLYQAMQIGDIVYEPKHSSELYNLINKLLEENQKYKEVIDKSIKCIDYNNRYRNGADIYQFVDIKGEILEPLKDILEQNEENSNIYLKEFNDWLKEVEHE